MWTVFKYFAFLNLFIYLVSFISFGLVWRHIEFLTILQKIQLCHHRNTFKNILKPIYWTDELLVAEILTYCVWLRHGVRLIKKNIFSVLQAELSSGLEKQLAICLVCTCMQSISPLQLHLHPRLFGWFYYVFFSLPCLICVFILTFAPVAWYLLLPTLR